MKKITVFLCGLFLLLSAGTAAASYVLFDQPTDTINVNGQIVLDASLTFEARIFFTNEYNGSGKIFNEWTNGFEDKVLSASPQGFAGYSFPTALNSAPFVSDAAVSLGISHHLAYVYDGSEERLYLDGQLMDSRAANGNVGNSSGNGHIGAIFRDGYIQSGFIGYLDTLRISNTARYSGSNFLPVQGDLIADVNTLLLYNFTEAPDSSVVYDLSGNDHTGTFGFGFSGATSPSFSSPVPIPSAFWLLGSGLIGLVGLGRRKLK